MLHMHFLVETQYLIIITTVDMLFVKIKAILSVIVECHGQ